MVLDRSMVESVSKATRPLKEAPPTAEIVLETDRFSLPHRDRFLRTLQKSPHAMGTKALCSKGGRSAQEGWWISVGWTLRSRPRAWNCKEPCLERAGRAATSYLSSHRGPNRKSDFWPENGQRGKCRRRSPLPHGIRYHTVRDHSPHLRLNQAACTGHD
jgi:hypothetical protein